MIKLKKPLNKKQRTSFFLYKEIDMEYTIDIKSTWTIRYLKDEGELRFQKYFDDFDRTLSMSEHLHTPSFIENLISFFMFRINSIRIDIHNLWVPVRNYDLDLNYYICFFPTTDFGVINPFIVINNPKSLIVTTKQPYAFQEIVFPKSYLKGTDMQGFGVWMSSDFNSLYHDIPACIQIANQYINLVRDFNVGVLTLITSVSFRGKR